MAGSRVLVTGGGGLLGTHVVAAMTPDHAVEVLDLRRPAADVMFRPVDLRDLDAVRSAVRGHDRVIHLAGIDDGTEVPDHRYMEVNVQGTWNLLQACEDSEMPLLPGAATATEVMRLMERGYRLQKFFPAEASGGVPALKSIGGPLPQVTFCPTGGIGLANAATYLALSNTVCVGGSWVAPKALVDKRDWQAIEALARQAAQLLG